MYGLLLHVTREFYSIQLICRNLYAIFSHVKKAYTANQNIVKLFFTCGRITNQRCKGLCEPIRIMHHLHSNNFSDLAAFLVAASPNFSCEGGGKLWICVSGLLLRRVCMDQENKNTSSKSQRDLSLLKKNFSFKEQAERD